MPLKLLAVIAGAATVLTTTAGAQSTSDEHPIIHRSSPAFTEDAAAVIRFLDQNGFAKGLQSPTSRSVPRDELEARKRAIQTVAPIPELGRGDPNVVYDVILQPGHYGRTKGASGVHGRRISEQQLTAYVAHLTADRLRGQGLNVLVVAADDFVRDDPRTSRYEGLRAKLFLALHAYGPPKRCSEGPSLVYGKGGSTYAMHALGWALASGRGFTYADLRKYGFPVGPAGYYMFDQVRTSVFSGSLEIGQLNCPTSEVVLIQDARFIATDLAHAIDFVLTVPYARSTAKP